MPELLLELISEEIPARMQARGAEDLRRRVCERLTEARLAFGEVRSFATPRRLALVVEGLPRRQPDATVERKGPRVGAPEKAIAGFLKSAGLASLDQCERRETDKGRFWFAVRSEKGRPGAELLAGLLPQAIGALRWPRSMRWGAGGLRWVRPLRGALCLFDGAPVALDLGAGVTCGAITRGHPFLAPEPFEVRDFADYAAKLRAAKVVLDGDERARIIREGAAAAAKAKGLALKPDEALVAENAGLVEWPVVLIGRIGEAFMSLPPEVLASAMREHQKYFATLDRDGRLAPRFVMVADIETADGGAAIVKGNERVLRARLADARFFWDRDRKRPLAERAPELAGIVFHAKLGTLDAKVDRLQALAVEIAGRVEGAARDKVRSAARLCKADLVTEMVGEFPDLQGVMGRYYALDDGEDSEVADAIAWHYAPRGPDDACPSAPVSVALALADKIDTLVGFWLIGEKPTGSKDPFALRRAALGVIRLIVENDIRLPLNRAFDAARKTLGGEMARHATPERSRRVQEALDDLLAFFAERLKVHLRAKGVRHDLIAAAFEPGGEDDLVRLLAKVEALAGFLATEDGANLLTAYRRAANILAIEEKRDGASYDGAPDPACFAQDEERTLAEAIGAAGPEAARALEAEGFERAMAALAKLRGPVDDFFDRVTVNCGDAERRKNRLLLLSRIRAALDEVADFSRIEG